VAYPEEVEEELRYLLGLFSGAVDAPELARNFAPLFPVHC